MKPSSAPSKSLQFHLLPESWHIEDIHHNFYVELAGPFGPGGTFYVFFEKKEVSFWTPSGLKIGGQVWNRSARL